MKVKTSAVMTVIRSRLRSTTVDPAIEPPSEPPRTCRTDRRPGRRAAGPGRSASATRRCGRSGRRRSARAVRPLQDGANANRDCRQIRMRDLNHRNRSSPTADGSVGKADDPAKSSGSSDAPPTSAPSMPGRAMSSAMLPGFTLPPYWIRTASPAAVARGLGRPRPGSPRSWPRRPRASRCAGADRPDRLVGDDARRRPSSLDTPANASATWPSDLALGRAGLALLERLADAHDRRHLVREDRPDLAVHRRRRSRRTARGAPSGPTITYSTFSLASITGLTSPVNAPSFSQ